ncbi:MAG: hypothetical protein KatS3mg005_3416 [Bryobacteraceae bacterium]|jgi:hypothetical protein|nr:MAG: hypothetical protein KatS3mg005_3416 [Bryobacteraceae bacterium]
MAEKKQNAKLWAVFQRPAGSLTLGAVRLAPFAAVAVDPATAALACPETTPVRFFDSEKSAEAEIERIRAEAAKS